MFSSFTSYNTVSLSRLNSFSPKSDRIMQDRFNTEIYDVIFDVLKWEFNFLSASLSAFKC